MGVEAIFSMEENGVTKMESGIGLELKASVWTHGFQNERKRKRERDRERERRKEGRKKKRKKYVHVFLCFGHWEDLSKAKT